MKHALNRTSGIALTLAMTLAAPGYSFAQDATVMEDEIIVTARARAESIQDIPLAITAFDEAALEEKTIQGLDDVARFTSGLSFESFSGAFATPVIRGQAQTRVTSLEPNVSTFFDGIYLPRSWNVDVGTASLSRIEIVKGPQSARYGRNAFAGAINYIPQKADISDKLSGEFSGTIGSDDRYDAGISVNVSNEDTFAVAGSYNYSSFDGSWDNAHPFADSLDLDRGTNGNVGGWSNEAASVSASWQPTDRFGTELAYYYFDVEQEARASRYLSSSSGDTNCGVGNRLFCGEFPDPADDAIVDPRSFGVVSTTDILRFSANYDLTESVNISYVYGRLDGDIITGTSGEPNPIDCGGVVSIGPVALCNFQVTPVGGVKSDSHEVRLDFDNQGPFRFAVGGFLSSETDNSKFTSVNIRPITDANNFTPFFGNTDPIFDIGGLFTGAADALNIVLGDTTTETDVTSVFGEVQWTSPDGQTRVGGELRYSETDIEASDNRRGNNFEDTYSSFAPRLTVERDLNGDSLLFASVAQGTKAGGFNTTATLAANSTFDEERNTTFEIGMKNRLADGALTLNGAVFYTDWNDVQINSPDPGSNDPNSLTITQNLGDATVFGVELDAAYALSDNFSVDATFSYSNSEYGDGTVDNRFSRTPAQCDDVVCNSNGNVGGNKVERTPSTQASLGAEYTTPMSSWDGDFYLRGDVSYQSKAYAESANISEIPSRFLMNARTGINFDGFEISLWARNLLDEKYVSNSFVVLLPGPRNPNTYGNFYGERRTFGLTGKYKY